MPFINSHIISKKTLVLNVGQAFFSDTFFLEDIQYVCLYNRHVFINFPITPDNISQPTGITIFHLIKDISGRTGISIFSFKEGHIRKDEHLLPSIDIVQRLMKVFAVSADNLLNDSEDSVVEMQNHELNEQLMLINQLDEDEKNALIKIINSMLTKKRMKDLLDGKVNF